MSASPGRAAALREGWTASGATHALRPKTAFPRFPPVHRTDFGGQLRGDLARSPSRRCMTAICAFRPFTPPSLDRLASPPNITVNTTILERPGDCPSNADDGLLVRPSLIVVEKVHSNEDDDAFRAGRLAAARRGMPNLLSSRRTSPVVFGGTRDNRTHCPVDVIGGGRNSPINRRMSANRFLGMAISAIWNAT
jgi:hypothetical protein